MKLLKGIYGDIWWSPSPAWRKHYVEYMMCHMDWNNSVLKKTNKTAKEVAAGKHNCRGRIVRIPGKKGKVSNSWSHCCALWQLLGFGYRKTPELKTLFKISSKTQLYPARPNCCPWKHPRCFAGRYNWLHPLQTQRHQNRSALSGQAQSLPTCADLRQQRKPVQCSKRWYSQEFPTWADPTGSCPPDTPQTGVLGWQEGTLFQINNLHGWQRSPLGWQSSSWHS